MILTPSYHLSRDDILQMLTKYGVDVSKLDILPDENLLAVLDFVEAIAMHGIDIKAVVPALNRLGGH